MPQTKKDNRRIVLASRPHGQPVSGDFRLETTSMPEPGQGQVLLRRIGDRFDAIGTGAADKGTWGRILQPTLEGRMLYGFKDVNVGQRLYVQLIHTDIERTLVWGLSPQYPPVNPVLQRRP